MNVRKPLQAEVIPWPFSQGLSVFLPVKAPSSVHLLLALFLPPSWLFFPFVLNIVHTLFVLLNKKCYFIYIVAFEQLFTHAAFDSEAGSRSSELHYFQPPCSKESCYSCVSSKLASELWWVMYMFLFKRANGSQCYRFNKLICLQISNSIAHLKCRSATADTVSSLVELVLLAELWVEKTI